MAAKPAKKTTAKAKPVTKAQRKCYHVTFNRKTETWEMKLKGAKCASARSPRKTDAVARAKELAKKAKLGQVIVHKQDGKIQTEYTYGADPKRSKG